MSVILITGCSSGFGMLFAARLAASGNSVYATMRNLAKQNDLLEEVDRRGGEVHLLPLDVTDDESIRAVIRTIRENENRLDVLINNAGYGVGGFFEDLSEEEIREQMETNFFGTQKVTRHALPLMRQTAANGAVNGAPKIVNISSVGGRIATPALSAYAASKFALEGFSEALYHELQPFGVKVILVEPGSYRTRILKENGRRAARTGDPESPYTPYAKLYIDRIRRMLRSPDGMGNPEEVAKLIQKIVNTNNPRFRYVIGKGTRLRLVVKHIIPFRHFSRLMLRSIYGGKT